MWIDVYFGFKNIRICRERIKGKDMIKEFQIIFVKWEIMKSYFVVFLYETNILQYNFRFRVEGRFEFIIFLIVRL